MFTSLRRARARLRVATPRPLDRAGLLRRRPGAREARSFISMRSSVITTGISSPPIRSSSARSIILSKVGSNAIWTGSPLACREGVGVSAHSGKEPKRLRGPFQVLESDWILVLFRPPAFPMLGHGRITVGNLTRVSIGGILSMGVVTLKAGAGFGGNNAAYGSCPLRLPKLNRALRTRTGERTPRGHNRRNSRRVSQVDHAVLRFARCS